MLVYNQTFVWFNNITPVRGGGGEEGENKKK